MALIIKRAETEDEIRAAQDLSLKIISEELKLIPNTEDFNRYNNCSVYFIATEGEEVIGTMRLVTNNCTGKFPMEEGFQLPNFFTKQRDKTLEVSRGAIRKDKRGDNSHLILLGLLKALYQYAKENNYSYLCACMFPLILKTLIRAGWNFTWIGWGNSKMYGNFVIPVVLEIKDENVNFGGRK